MAKEVNLTFRVTPEFDNMIRVESGKLGMDMAEYVRMAIMLGRPLLNEYQVLKLIRLEDTIRQPQGIPEDRMSLFHIYASADDTEPFCSTLTDDPECCPAEALEMARQTCIGPELTDTAWAERAEA